MSYRLKAASQAIDAAKAYWPINEGEPLIAGHLVQLRELCNALERLLGNLPQEEGNWADTDAYLFVIEALKDGELTAKAFAPDTVIPSNSWSSVEASSGPEAYNSSFWLGVVCRDEDCHGFRGHLPVIGREAAEEWLCAIAARNSKPKKRNLPSTGTGRTAFKTFIAQHGPRGPTEAQRDRWSIANLQGGRDAGRELWRELKPREGSKPGPKSK